MLLDAGIALRSVADVTAGSIKLAQNPADGDLYYLTTGDGIYHVTQSQTNVIPKQVASAAEVGPGASATGMAIGPDGVFYVVADQRVGTNQNQATIWRGTAGSDGYRWAVVATTAPYPLSDTPFDHMVNGIVLSPDGKWLYVNSGSRTDHGEVEDNKGAFPDTREVGLTAKIFRIPSDAKNLMLPNDDAALAAQGYIFARGTRNAYDMAFAPNGDLFAVDNGPDADYPDELNWIREGQHYGFPWRFGTQDNPQQFPTYDSKTDKRLRDDFTAVKIGAYHTDPGFPKPAAAFTAPVRNLGPAAALNRADDGSQYDAIAKDAALATFTPHRSPLGLVFPTDPSVPAALRGSGDATGAFVLSWGAAGGTLTDKGQDLLHLLLRKNGDNYEAVDYTNGTRIQPPDRRRDAWQPTVRARKWRKSQAVGANIHVVRISGIRTTHYALRITHHRAERHIQQ